MLTTMDAYPATARDDPADDFPFDEGTLESIDEFVKALGISRRSGYDVIERENVPTVHVGRRHLIRKNDRIRLVRKLRAREAEAREAEAAASDACCRHHTRPEV